MNYIILIAVAIISFAIGRKTAKSPSSKDRTFASKKPEELKKIQEEAHVALTERTEKRKEKILDLMRNEAAHKEELEACNISDIKKGITSANVKKLFDVSGATARKYLNELEDENKIKQTRERGRNVRYILNT